MNFDPDFEVSADMRLLELQRSSLGLAPHDRSAWESRYTLEGGPMLDSAKPSEPRGTSAVLSVEANASPASGVIPGAIVTFSLSIVNEGAVTATGIVAGAPIPGGASFRAGSFVQDGRGLSDDSAEHFFGAGLPIAELKAGSRTTFVWKTGVRLGSKPLVLAPQVSANVGAVIGARPLTVTRKDQPHTVFTTELDRAGAELREPKALIPVDIPADDLPFYELDEEEELVHEAADAALSAPQKFEAQPEPPPPIVENPPAAVAPSPEPPREAVVRYGKFDRTTLVFFERTFLGSKPPTILQHCIFANALACSTDADGNDRAGLKRHLDAQSQVLHRIVLHERLGKKEPIAEYAGELLADIDDLVPGPVVSPPLPATSEFVPLMAELGAPTVVVISRISQERDRWDFVKARQLTLALQAQRAFAGDEAQAAAIENALRAYAQASMTTLQKLFVRIRIDRTTGLLFAQEPALDAAARGVIAALSAAIKR